MMATMPRQSSPRRAQPLPTFDLHTFLDSSGIARKISKYRRSAVIFSQGDPATDVFYIQEGSVKLSVLSRTGKEAVVGMLGPGDFFGEGCLAGQPRRMATASAMSPSAVNASRAERAREVMCLPMKKLEGTLALELRHYRRRDCESSLE